jgi:hypothetical protein
VKSATWIWKKNKNKQVKQAQKARILAFFGAADTDLRKRK